MWLYWQLCFINSSCFWKLFSFSQEVALAEWIWSYLHGLLQSLISNYLVQRYEAHSLSIHLFNFLKPFHIVIMTCSFYLFFYKYCLNQLSAHKNSKLFEVVCLHLHTVITLYCLDWNKIFLNIFEYSCKQPCISWTRTESVKTCIKHPWIYV